MSVVLAPWGRVLRAHGLAGSLFAVNAADRVAAAHALDAEGLAVHADVILDRGGAHRGVDPAQIERIRGDLPHARIDVHLILDDDTLTRTAEIVAETVAVSERVRAERLTVSRAVLRAHRAPLQGARSRGLPVWCEVVHNDHEAATAADEDADGCLVMLIRPGTTDLADSGGLATIRSLQGRVPVGVDGGVTEDLARVCADGGVSPIVSGRALLTAQLIGDHTHVH
ncbi:MULTISPECIES: hypothetical protein [Actinomycetes]|uniref:hypothetical protein n=1 Tax=Actinomycetes TaxID=1760 RepID=UPI0010A77F95|nr:MULTISPECIES: hypothetical protein [Actinomycetes]